MKEQTDPKSLVRIGVSSCLLGERVRYDGGHKRHQFLVDVLGPHVEWVPVCPEVELGLGTPRETIRLVRVGSQVRMEVPATGRDLTGAMRRFARKRVAQLQSQRLSGYILKKDSPSCGMERVRVYNLKGAPAKNGRGLFAEALMTGVLGLPVEEEGRLMDHRLRENFIERVFAYRRIQDLFADRWSLGDLVRFHTTQKLTLMAHSPAAYKKLGRLVAGAKAMPRGAFRKLYSESFMNALTVIATPRRHANVLMHILGYFKRTLDPDSRAEILQLINDYRLGLVPLIVPITLIRHHVRRLGQDYLSQQVYLDPHPRELMLRNHV